MYALFLERDEDLTLNRAYPDGSVCRFRLLIGDEAGATRTLLTEFVCEPRELRAWFGTHRHALIDERAPEFLPKGSSLAKRITNFYQQVDVEDPMPDDMMDAVYAYRQRHGLRFALRGVDVPDIYFGLHNSGHEISCADEPTWDYPVDLRRFLTEFVGT